MFTSGEKFLLGISICLIVVVAILLTEKKALKDECEKDLLRTQVCVMAYVLKEGE